MRIPQHIQQAVALFLPLWATAATAISLSNFTPRINDLPSACNTVYTQAIPGCQVSDFTANAQCSKACINGLVQISAEVNSQCANADVPETSIIGVFLLGQGIPALCNNTQVTTAPATTQDGPLTTGKPITYTVTAPSGAIVTTTAAPIGGNGETNSGGKSGTNIAAIIAAVIAGVLAIVAAYFAFCAWVYRKQLILYKNHAAMAQRAATDPARAEKDAFMLAPSSSAGTGGRDAGSAVGSSGAGSRPSRPSGTSGWNTGGSGSGSGSDGIAVAGGAGAGNGGSLGRRRSSSGSSTDDLLAGQEPAFWGSRGVLLNPRRSLRVINWD